VYRGGIKKKSHIKALRAAERTTGIMSQNKAIIESVTSRIYATTLYPMKPERKKLMPENTSTRRILKIY
jgi:hypothetical protein